VENFPNAPEYDALLQELQIQKFIAPKDGADEETKTLQALVTEIEKVFLTFSDRPFD
jgi:hypothetical protein